MKRGAVHVVAVAAYFIPPVSAALMALLFREVASGWLIPGALLITAGAVIAARSSGAQ
jgi:drug/metabolite transporter (DMT)-like permease